MRCVVGLLAWAMLCLLPVAQATTPIQGWPLLHHYGANQLPAPPAYADVVVTSDGSLYAGSGEGVMLFRSGVWEVLEVAGSAPVYSLLLARDGSIYVAGNGVFGQLRPRPDGTHDFVDLLPRLASAGPLRVPAEVYSLGETSRGIHAVSAGAFFELRSDGTTSRRALVGAGSFKLMVAGDEVYYRVEGEGLYRMGASAPERVAGTGALADLRVAGVWAYQGGLLVAAGDGFHFSDGRQLHKLGSEADTAFVQHAPYTGIALANGGWVIGSSDGTVLRFSPDLRLLDSVRPNRGGMHDFVEDAEGSLWVVGESGLTRLRLSLPWTRYDHRHGLGGRLFDSTWYDGQLWVAGMGVWRARASAGSSPQFSQLPWPYPDMETFALRGTDAGLVVGDRHGLMVLDPGADQPRRLLDVELANSVTHLLPSAFNSRWMLARGIRQMNLLEQRDGRWQVRAQWPSQVRVLQGLYEVAPGEVWAGDGAGGVHYWRLDLDTGQLQEHRRYTAEQGVLLEPGYGTRVFASGGELYAISGMRVSRWNGERFVAAALPPLPGLMSPWELEGQDNEQGGFAWTSRQLWWRRPGATDFELQRVGDGRMPGFATLALHRDGQVRVVTRDSVLQLDGTHSGPTLAPASARLDRIELRRPGHGAQVLPLSPAAARQLPAGAGLVLRFGIQSMEPEVEFRYRMPGYHDVWSPWSAGRELAYQRLPGGDYTFQLQARVRGDLPTEPVDYPLQVAAFWYQRVWAWLLFGGVGVVLVAVVVRLRTRSVNARNRELEWKIAARTAALEAANARLSALAVTDGLTGIANRHAMEKALQRLWQGCARHNEPLAVMMIDVDHFKRFNDSYGHHMGDLQLRRVADILSAGMRDADELVARYGGEEFMVILPACEAAAAASRAEQLRSAVEQETARAGLPVTISVGVAVAHPQPDEDPMALVRCADQALYRVKFGGRNRVEAAVLDDWATVRT